MKNLAITLAMGVANAAICVVIALVTGLPKWAALPLAIVGAIALFELEPRLRARFGRQHLPSVAGLAFATALALLTTADPARARGGGLNAEGCHNDRKGGTGYHCHRGGGASRRPAAPRRAFSGGGSFANCTAARAAGAAPVRAGDPGYGRHLDRDGDGIGCE